MEQKFSALRVLVVDDEALMRWSIVETLTDLGYSVIEAGDADSALRALVDVSGSLALLSTIRRVAPTSQVIMMTAYGTPDDTKGALNLGAHRVMNKPFEMREIVAAVQQAHRAGPH